MITLWLLWKIICFILDLVHSYESGRQAGIRDRLAREEEQRRQLEARELLQTQLLEQQRELESREIAENYLNNF